MRTLRGMKSGRDSATCHSNELVYDHSSEEKDDRQTKHDGKEPCVHDGHGESTMVTLPPNEQKLSGRHTAAQRAAVPVRWSVWLGGTTLKPEEPLTRGKSRQKEAKSSEDLGKAPLRLAKGP